MVRVSTGSLSTLDLARILTLWADVRGRIYAYATVPEFLRTLYAHIEHGNLFVGRDDDRMVQAVLVAVPRGATVYIEAYFGPIHYARAGLDILPAHFERVAYHKRNQYFEHKFYGTR